MLERGPLLQFLENICHHKYDELLSERILSQIGLLTVRHFSAFVKAHIAARYAADRATTLVSL